jgi:hypothetical protein
MSVGNTCGLPGIQWTYNATTPAFGAGWLAMVQLGYWSWSGTYSVCVMGVHCTFSGGGPPYELDAQFPYDSSVSSNQAWANFDDPAYPIAAALSTSEANVTDCSSITYAGWIQDYFIYQPSVPQSRQGQAIWVATNVTALNYAGTAYPGPYGSWSLTNVTQPSPTISTNTLPSWPSIVQAGPSECIQ